MNAFLDSKDVQDNGPELYERIQRDGYLFISGLLPTKLLEKLRLDFVAIARQAGWVKVDVPMGDAIADLNAFCVEPEPRYMEVYSRMYKLEAFHLLAHHPNIIGLFERMFGGPVMPHPKLGGRSIFPQREAFTTPGHQDFVFIQGTNESYTTWIPLHNVSPEMGGLQIASGSHKHGVYKYRPARGAGGMEVINSLEGTWVNNPFKQGDVLIFHCMTVHKGLPCTGERLRMSIDARYQRVGEPVAPGWVNPHVGTWEEIYAGWSSNELKYYWKQWDLDVKAYDRSYIEKRDILAFEMAEQGDRQSISALQRIVASDKDPSKCQKAEKVLATLSKTATAP